MIDAIENLPEVSFIDNIKLENVQANMVTAYKEKWSELNDGKECTLDRADPIALLLYACSVQLFHILLYVDRTGKMDLLKYAYDEFLDNYAAGKGVTRLPAKPAVVTVRFSISEARTSATSIPAGTRVKSGDVFFHTDAYAEISAGSTYVDVTCTCDTNGTAGNGFIAGDISTLVDSVPYISSVANTETSSGGAEIEDDEDMADRVYLAPSGYSTAGPMDAYEYHVREFNPSIGSVKVVSPSPCVVNIYVLMDDGSIPSLAIRTAIQNHLSSVNIRPLTDNVSVLAPGTSSFNIELTYYINRSDQNKAASIQEEVESAVDDFIEWQTRTVGRDINPSELESLIMDAGAKRVVITYPVFTVVGDTNIPRLGTSSVIYGGLEDD